MGLFAPPKHPVMSLLAHAEEVTLRREQSQIEVLVRHLLFRFFHNELLGSDDETKRVMQISYAVALPGLLVAMFLFPAYHAFPPFPLVRPFWLQTGDHYFYVMYSFVLMGAATVYEWDLLFPDLLDVFVLSILPISNQRLFFCRVLAVAIFLALVLLGTSILGMVSLPLIAELPNAGRHVVAHTVAVLASGSFAAATFLAVQGVLLNVAGERFFRRVTPVLQGGSLMVLLAVLLLYPTIAHSMEALMLSGSAAVRWFPPFWFLGVYERMLGGATAPAIFRELAHTAWWALLVVVAATVLTYPLAYRRRMHQLIEGVSAGKAPGRRSMPLQRLLHVTLLRTPASRAIFHFISQTVLRSQKHRVMLAMYGGLSVALALANMVVLYLHGSHVRPSLLPEGIRAAIPIMAFWMVAGLSSVVASPVDRRGAWVFRVVLGHPRGGHYAGMRIWIVTWATMLSLATLILLHGLSPAGLRTPKVTAGQMLMALGLSVLLADVFLYATRALPFTQVRVGSITDFPLMIFRYFVLFPIFVALVLHYEAGIEASVWHLVRTLMLLLAIHLGARWLHARALDQVTVDTPPGEADEFPQRLGLRDS